MKEIVDIIQSASTTCNTMRMVLIKFMFSKKATKIDEIFTTNLTVTSYCQIDSEDFVNFCGLRKREL